MLLKKQIIVVVIHVVLLFAWTSVTGAADDANGAKHDGEYAIPSNA